MAKRIIAGAIAGAIAVTLLILSFVVSENHFPSLFEDDTPYHISMILLTLGFALFAAISAACLLPILMHFIDVGSKRLQKNSPYYQQQVPYVPVPDPVEPFCLCPHCARPIGLHDSFCKHCGLITNRSCPHCGHYLAGDEEFCPDCGSAFTREV